MQYTDTQLKQALAKMLPEDLYQPKGDDDVCWSNASEKCHRDRRGYYVLDTELLHLCWLVGKDVEAKRYSDYLMHAIQDEICTGAVEARYATANATWQQRTIALAKVKGVEIV